MPAWFTVRQGFGQFISLLIPHSRCIRVKLSSRSPASSPGLPKSSNTLYHRFTSKLNFIALNLLRSILPPLLASIQSMRSRGDCERLFISRIATSLSYWLLPQMTAKPLRDGLCEPCNMRLDLQLGPDVGSLSLVLRIFCASSYHTLGNSCRSISAIMLKS